MKKASSASTPFKKRHSFLSILFVACASFVFPERVVTGEVPPIRVVYFTPSDRKPAPDIPTRLFRVMSNIQEFYRAEMERAGYGSLTFALDTEPDDPLRLRVHYVTGKEPASFYTRGAYNSIREEVTESLTKGEDGNSPLHPASEIVVVFQRLLAMNDEGEFYHQGPIVGSGNHLFGIALAMDDERLDADLLTSELPAESEGQMSLGEFNTRYIGALAHELGHAFGLLHNSETDIERRTRGYSLMGIGNNCYGAQLRNAGKGAFLTSGDTLRLSRCRAFAGDLPFAFTRPKWRLLLLKGEFTRSADGTPELLLKGRIESSVRLIGVTAYNDDAAIPSDYDAKSFTAIPNEEGYFELKITELAETEYQLRLVGICANGATIGAEVFYKVDADLSPSGLNSINTFAPEIQIRRLFECWNIQRLREVIQELEDRDADPVLIRKGKHLLSRMTNPPVPVSPSNLPDNVTELRLSEAEWENARNGINKLLRDRVPSELFITVGGQFYEQGLFAHAPSVHRFRLQKKWGSFYTAFGLADGHCGSVRFRIIGDGEELYASSTVRDHRTRDISVSVKDVDVLDLVVEPTNDGNSHDWGIWLNPLLSRKKAEQ